MILDDDQEIFWPETTEEEMERRVFQYLRKNHTEFIQVRKEKNQLLKQHPVLKELSDSSGDLILTKEQHQAYLECQHLRYNEEAIVRKYFYLLGQADMIPYVKTLDALSNLGKNPRTPEGCLYSSVHSKTVQTPTTRPNQTERM